MQQTFLTGQEPRVRLGKIHGSLTVRGWDRREINIDLDGDASAAQQEGNVLTLADCSGDLELRVPYDADVRVEKGVEGDVSVQDIRRIELKNSKGDVELKNIGSVASQEPVDESVLLIDLAGDLQIKKASSVRARGKIKGDASLEEVALVEIETVEGDFELSAVEIVSIGNVGGDLEAEGVNEALHCGNVGGDCKIDASKQSEIHLGNVGGDLEVQTASLIHLGNVGGDCELRSVAGVVHIGNVGGDLDLSEVGSELSVGMVGADADLRGLNGSVRVGGVGGDLAVQGNFPPESKVHLQAGGDVVITLPVNANLALQATSGGSIRGSGLTFKGHGNMARLVYGAGEAQLYVSTGGDLELRGGGNPQVSSTSMPWGEFGREMADLGQQLGQDFANTFGNMDWNIDWSGSAWVDEAARKAEEHAGKIRRKAEQNARKAAEQARKAAERAQQAGHSDRFFVRVNEREWQMNPERLNDLANRAQQAAMDGVAGAMEAVERAVNNLRMPRPPYPSRPDQPPVPPVPPVPPTGRQWTPMPPMPPMPPMKPMTPMTPMQPMGQPPFTPPPSKSVEPQKPDLEQEREAILRMIAEGRITPEEGDMLLEGLGS